MNNLHSPTKSRWSDDDMDNLLRGFFRAEVPAPWPEIRAPEAAPRRAVLPARQRWFRVGARLALAASIGFILVAYLALARNFPQVNNQRQGIEPVTPPIGQKQRPPKRVTTPQGREALMWEDNVAGERIIINLEMIKGQSPR